MKTENKPDARAKVAGGFSQAIDDNPGELESSTMRLPANHKRKLEEAAKRENLKLSDLVRRAMREYIERNGL